MNASYLARFCCTVLLASIPITGAYTTNNTSSTHTESPPALYTCQYSKYLLTILKLNLQHDGERTGAARRGALRIIDNEKLGQSQILGPARS